METSLRYSGDSKSLRIHAKEKIPIGANTICQFHGELDTKLGAATYATAMIRHFYPDISSSIGGGVQYKRNEKLHYNFRAKKAFPVTADNLVSFNIKGRCVVDEEFKKVDYTGAAEFAWNIFNVKKEQDLRIKIGYNMIDKIPYMQIRENNWTFNADANRKWNLRYDL